MDSLDPTKPALLFIEPYYSVVINNGNATIRSSSNKLACDVLSQWKQKGYFYCKMNDRAVAIHDLIATAYLGTRPDELCVNHKNGVKTDNRPENLEYVTLAENTRHSMRIGHHVCCYPERTWTYIDGRCLDIPAYKRYWYKKNAVRLREKAKQRYLEKKKGTK
jgi:hypothetical protein